MSLTLSNIEFTYGAGTSFASAALADVSLEVALGELVLVVGATGSGKSTLLRIAAGLLEADGGACTIDGAKLDRASARGSVGLVFQDAEAQLFADTVLDDVAFGPRNLGLPLAHAAQRARETLSSVGLDPDAFGDRSPFALSGGEARRAAVAGVLAMRPRYLLADEPTAGLDASGRRALRALLLESRKQAGVVVVSHAAEEFLPYADRVLILAAGRTVWHGAASLLVADPTPLAQARLVAPDVLEVQRLARLAGISVAEFALDPVLAAQALASAGGWV